MRQMNIESKLKWLFTKLILSNCRFDQNINRFNILTKISIPMLTRRAKNIKTIEGQQGLKMFTFICRFFQEATGEYVS